MDLIVVDLTRAKRAGEVALLQLVFAELGRPADQYRILALERQEAAVRREWPDLHVETLDPLLPAAEVALYLRSSAVEATSVARLVAFTFHNDVVDQATEIAAAHPSIEVNVEHLSRFSNGRSLAAPAVDWPKELMEIDDAADLLVACLVAAKKPIKQTSLRGLLASADPRFKKSNPVASSSKLVGRLVEHARDRGDITIVGDAGNPTLALAPRAPLPEPTQATTVRVGSKSRRYVDILRKHGLGYQAARPHIHEQLQRVVKDLPGTPLSEVIDLVISGARGQWQARGDGATLPWHGVRESFEKLLQAAPVTLDEAGAPTRPTWAGAGTPVHGLKDDWRQELDSESILCLVRAGEVIRHSDIRDLAGALLLDRSNDSQQYVYGVVNLLVRQGRLLEREGVLFPA